MEGGTATVVAAPVLTPALLLLAVFEVGACVSVWGRAAPSTA